MRVAIRPSRMPTEAHNTTTPPPSTDNEYLADHVSVLLKSLNELTGRTLVPLGLSNFSAAKTLYEAPFVVLSHNTAAEPVFNYANLTAQRLFELNWGAITTLPSRKSAEAVERDERSRLLQRVTENGYIDDYTGIRISSSGRRFRVYDAVVWNMYDTDNVYCGQGATFSRWTFV